jgi:hypothetical protein
MMLCPRIRKRPYFNGGQNEFDQIGQNLQDAD